MQDVLRATDPRRPVLIVGPTASGKSALALALARAQGGIVVNADAIQVYADWRVLTARPGPEDLASAPHALYGHVPGHRPYSVGDWLRDVARFLQSETRPIIVGGTGLYFSALTEGLVDIPEIPDSIRQDAMRRSADGGHVGMLHDIDATTRARIDIANPMRVQRAWEVQMATGRGLADWQDDTPPPLLPLDHAETWVVEAPKDWLTPRIEARFDRMLEAGALDEARANLPDWTPDRPSAKAIGAAELIAHLRGAMTLAEAKERATIQTRRYAKRQRTWLRARMGAWRRVDARDLQP